MTPHELVAELVVPKIRSLIASRLIEKGMSQIKIAKLLGVSQPMISKYLKESEEETLKKLSSVGIREGEIIPVLDILVDLLVQGKYGEYLSVLTSYLNSLLSRGVLCQFHRSQFPYIPQDCEICMQAFQSITDPLVEDVRNAYELLAIHPLIPAFVPQVGMNIVSSLPSPKSINDTVGYSGRIVKVGKRIQAVGIPIRGGSQHTGRVLLSIARFLKDVRGCVVIKYSEDCLNSFKRRNMRVIRLGPHKSEEEFFMDLSSEIRRVKSVDVIADLGGIGMEPVIYVLGSSAVEAAKKVISCLDELSK